MWLIERWRQNSFWWYQGPMIACALILFSVSSIPGDRIPEYEFFTHDKLIHFMMYVTFAAVVYRAIRSQRRFPLPVAYPYLFTIVLVALYGASDELHQYFVPNRTCSFYDWLADSAGAIVFAGLHWLKVRLSPAVQSA